MTLTIGLCFYLVVGILLCFQGNRMINFILGFIGAFIGYEIAISNIRIDMIGTFKGFSFLPVNQMIAIGIGLICFFLVFVVVKKIVEGVIIIITIVSLITYGIFPSMLLNIVFGILIGGFAAAIVWLVKDVGIIIATSITGAVLVSTTLCSITSLYSPITFPITTDVLPSVIIITILSILGIKIQLKYKD